MKKRREKKQGGQTEGSEPQAQETMKHQSEHGDGEEGQDPESLGSAVQNDPLVTGIPNDPKNRKLKRWSYFSIVMIGFALAIDFTMSMMSIQTFYYVLNGPQNLYGFTFGSYDLAALISAPVLGYLSDHLAKFKILIGVCLVLNGIGNLIYAFTYLGNKWWMMLISRLVAGSGAAALALGSSYITITTTMADRQKQLVTYRVSQSLARMFGPFVGYFFLGLPSVSSGSSTALKVFNWYTIPGWVAFAIIALLSVMFLYIFQDPTEENECIVKRVDDGAKPSKERLKEFWMFSGTLLGVAFLSTFLQFAYYSNMFAIFAGQYHAVTNQVDQWKVFVGVGAGAALASFIYRVGVKRFNKVFHEQAVSAYALWLLVACLLLVIPYDGSTSVPKEATFYASAVLFGLSAVLSAPSFEAFFSKKITQYGDVIGDNIAKYLGIFYMAMAGGRFAGPLVAGAVTYIATPSGEQSYCANGYGTQPDGSPMCEGDTSQDCAIFPDEYYVSGCVLKNSIPFYATMAGIAGVLAIVYPVFILRRYSSYENTTAQKK